MPMLLLRMNEIVDLNLYYIKKACPIRKVHIPGVKNVKKKSLIGPKRILFPPFHVKLSLIKQFVNALPQEGECFRYFCEESPD